MLLDARDLCWVVSVLLLACATSPKENQARELIDLQEPALSEELEVAPDNDEPDQNTHGQDSEDLSIEREMNENADYQSIHIDSETDSVELSAAPMEIAIADGLFQQGDDAKRALGYARAKGLGVTWLRANVAWGSEDPFAMTRMIKEAHEQGLRVQLTLTGDSTKKKCPDPAEFGKFVHDAVERYCAIGVHRYSVWNEPNAELRTSKGCPQKQPADIYRSLYLRAYKGARQGAADAEAKSGTECNRRQLRIMIGELHPGGIIKQRQRDPIPFLQRMLKGHKLLSSGPAIHPYQYTISPATIDSGHPGGIGSLANVQKFLREVQAAGTLMTANRKVLPLYLTEFGYLKSKCNLCDCKSRVPGVPCNDYVCPSNNCLTEGQRAKWSYEANVQAEKVGARQMLYYHLTTNSPCRGGDWDSSLTDHMLRPRQSYCKLKQWAFDKGYISDGSCDATAEDPPCNTASAVPVGCDAKGNTP